MEPRWALVRVKRAREHDHIASRDDVSDGVLDFEQSLFRVSMTGAVLPYSITGTVKAETTPDGLVVTASASLGSLIAALVFSVIGISVGFRLLGLLMSPMYWMWLGLAGVAILVHTLQTVSALRRMTGLATALDSAA